MQLLQPISSVLALWLPHLCNKSISTLPNQVTTWGITDATGKLKRYQNAQKDK
jgi:hypothetical protein